jgi:ribosomal protein S18 acetylase RimI-like enzyme
VNQIGGVKSTYGTNYDIFWNPSSGEIRVASELAGYSKTEYEVTSKAEFKKESYNIVRVKGLQELEQAFSYGLIQAYQSIFAEPPYEEYFSDDRVREMFNAYFSHDTENQTVILAYKENEVVAFCSAVPFNEKWLDFKVTDESTQTSHDCHKYLQTTFELLDKNTMYLDDLGVEKGHRRKGLARQIIEACLSISGSKNIFLRTSDNNLASQLLYQKVGFSIIDRLSVLVSQERQDGTIREDRRIIMVRQAT